MNEVNNPIVTIAGAAEILGLSKDMVRWLINSRKIIPLGKVGPAWVLDRRQIELLKRQREAKKK